MKTNTLTLLMKPHMLAATLALSLLVACKPQQETTASMEDLLDAPPAAAVVADPADPAAPAAPAAPATPDNWVRYEAQPTGSKSKIEGTSTIHDWEMNSPVIGGFMEVDPNFPASALTDAKAARPTVQVFMPVRTFKSSYKKMDEVMQEHMNMAQHPRIEYKLIELKPKSEPGATGALEFEATGVLTINGTERTNTMPVTIEKVAGDRIKVAGSTPLKMTDFGVKPPAPNILGMSPIRTGDDIKITFEWLSALKAS